MKLKRSWTRGFGLDVTRRGARILHTALLGTVPMHRYKLGYGSLYIIIIASFLSLDDTISMYTPYK